MVALTTIAFDWQVYVSLLRMYLEPPKVGGKENMKPNIAVALNVLEEHRQKISTAKVSIAVYCRMCNVM